MSRHLFFIHHAYSIEIVAFVLMKNSFHLLLRTPLNNLSEAMRYFMRETSREITSASGRINQTYVQRHSRTIISTHHYFLHAYKYVYRNPVVSGHCGLAEDYRFSTLNGLIGRSHLLIPVVEDKTLFSDLEGTLEWLNRPSSADSWHSVKVALRKSRFSLSRDPRTKGSNRLDFNAL